MKDQNIFITLATFNGERYLREQIRSIQQQTLTNWTLLISDDGSNDETLKILGDLAQNDSRIVILPRRTGAPGHASNFEHLLMHAVQAHAKFIFLADQDDIWATSKLEMMLASSCISGANYTSVFSDLEIIDSYGRPKGSFMQYTGLDGMHDLNGLLRQNFVVGCSLMIKSEILELALPFPKDLENHDWWLAMCAASLGQLKYLPERLVNYRQHGHNTIGAEISLRRLSKLRYILNRQRRVLDNKIINIAELIGRLQKNRLPVPEVLYSWLKQVSPGGEWRAAWRLLKSEFKPKSKVLLCLQLLALTPLTGTKRSIFYI
ncbi:glycosyltransferase family 2 protein [Parahaliea maris]|uniref:Glycosyltransferase family 2 protein n=1 Tax=Parahaliea maris TaxID=2716870 RepID=A0A5C9A9E6_9GAMM|nr:glycosyltransferase family 2 protein [Parahaliea maris]TXS96694.1 glycosyltransferase family 2 protein [Parahaliea maris]